MIKATSTSKLTEQHLLLILAAQKDIPQDIEAETPEVLTIWTQIFADLTEYLCLAFCNDSTCEYAETVLKSFMLAMKQHALQVFPTLHSTLLLIFPNVNTSSANFGPVSAHCQDTVVRFLLELYDESLRQQQSYFTSELENLVRNFPEYFAQTKLSAVIDRIATPLE